MDLGGRPLEQLLPVIHDQHAICDLHHQIHVVLDDDNGHAAGAKKALPLTVAGGYHSALMASAQPKLQAALAAVRLQSPTLTVVSNVTAKPHGAIADIQSLLVRQVTSSVRWEESMRYLLAQGFTRFIELGPGKALSGFMKRIDKNAQLFNVTDESSLETTAKAI